VSDKTQINVRISEGQKEDWEEYAEEDPTVQGGISGLVRAAVEQFITSNGRVGQNAQSTTDIPDDITQRLATIEDTLGDVHTVVTRVDQSVGYIEDEIAGTGERPFSDRLIRAIPPARPGTQSWKDARDTYEDRPKGEPIVWQGTVDAFSDQLDVDRDTIEYTLETLATNFDYVETAIVGDNRRFWTERDLERQPYADARELEAEVERRERISRKEAREDGAFQNE